MVIKYMKDKLTKSIALRHLILLFPDNVIKNLYPLREIIIEPSSYCNLQCPFCPQTFMPNEAKGMMSLENFKKIVSQLPDSIQRVTLHFSGESFAHPNIAEMIKLLKEKNITIFMTSNGTMPVELYKQAIKNGLDILLIDIDGCTKEKHEAYRVGSDFDKIKETIKELAREKSAGTELGIQFIVMKHTEEDIDCMKKMAKGLGIDSLWIKSASITMDTSKRTQERLIKEAKRFLPENEKYSRYKIRSDKIIAYEKPKVCAWAWRSVILQNGDVTICCTDLMGSVRLGNVFETDFIDIWNSKKYSDMRRSIIKQDLRICDTCSIANNAYVEKVRFK